MEIDEETLAINLQIWILRHIEVAEKKGQSIDPQQICDLLTGYMGGFYQGQQIDPKERFTKEQLDKVFKRFIKQLEDSIELANGMNSGCVQ